MRLLIATNNAGKVRELGEALRGLDVDLLRLADLGDAAPEAPEETGATFEENALLKARYCFERIGLASIADDSGLQVDALDGRPGVLSARYAGPDAIDADRVDLLLKELAGVRDRWRRADLAALVTARCAATASGLLQFPDEIADAAQAGADAGGPAGVAEQHHRLATQERQAGQHREVGGGERTQ